MGMGFTVIVNVCGVPRQPDADGVTVMVAITGAVVKLVAVKDPISPVPLAASPIEVLLFVQVKVVLLTAPLNIMKAVTAPLHNI